MTKTLKKRFIFFTMTAVTLLLVFIVLAINLLNFAMQDSRSDMMLKVIADANGSFHKMSFNTPPPHFEKPLNMDRIRASRFFTVRSDKSGNITEVNTSQISSIDTETAKSYAAKVIKSGEESGRLGKYKYIAKDVKNGKLIFFMDDSEQADNFRTVLFASTLIAVVCWVVLLTVVILLSGRVIRPVIAGMEKQKQFITNAGHEMKTPLAIIQSNNDTMALIHGENKYNAHIRNQTKRLNALMSNLLTLSKLDEGIPLMREDVNVSEIANEIIAVYTDSSHEKGLRFDVDIENGVMYQVNKDSFRQLITVLFDNAVKYTPTGGNIHFSLAKSGRHLRITEENTCDTTSEPNPERLFERFYRGDEARTQKNETDGYGIGLSAARAICENFGGKLTASYPTPDTIRFTAVF